MPARVDVEESLIEATRPALTAARVDTSGVSPRAWLDEPIAAALEFCGVLPADPLHPVDADLDRLAAADFRKFFDIAMLRVFNHAHQSIGFGAGVTRRWLSYEEQEQVQSADVVARILGQHEQYCRTRWGYGLGPLRGGTIRVVQRVAESEI